MTMTKTGKPHTKESFTPDTKPVQLAKLIYPAIVRYIKAKNSLAVGEKPKFTLDSANASRICVHSR